MFTNGARYKNAEQSVHLTCGSLRDLGAFFWLRVFPAPKHCPHPPTRRERQPLGVSFCLSKISFRKGVGAMTNQKILLYVFSIVAILIGTVSCTHSAPPLQPGDSERKVKVNDQERTYILHLPPGLDSVESVPVVFAFHEHGDTASARQLLTGFVDISD